MNEENKKEIKGVDFNKLIEMGAQEFAEWYNDTAKKGVFSLTIPDWFLLTILHLKQIRYLSRKNENNEK